MKHNKSYLLYFFFFIINEIIQTYTQNTSQDGITDEQLKSFSYGEEEFKLAIIGDSGTEREAREVMKLTTFDALLHLGDFDYSCMPDKYFEEILDSDRSYQFMGILGNHEGVSECGTEKNQKFLHNVYNQMVSSKNSKVKCEFSSSKFMWACVYKNMRIIGLTSGVNGADKREEQLSFLKKHLRDAKEDWKVCSWHFYDKYFHTGKYPNDGNIISGSGESFYDFCREHGAIIFSAHDHVYARTHVMSKFKDPTIDEYDGKTSEDIVQIREGATIDILNGAGGYEMYVEQGEQKDYRHWQKKYAKGSDGENAKKYGGLFCNFNYGGNNKKAYCEFLRINSSNKLFDAFYIYRNADPSTITYEQIDTTFKNEKIRAYKEANNIPLGDTSADSSGAVGLNKALSDNKGSSQDKKSLFNTKNIIIGGSVCAAAVVVGVGFLTFRKSSKEKSMDHDHETKNNRPVSNNTNYNHNNHHNDYDTRNSNEGHSYAFNAVSNTGQMDNDSSFYSINKKMDDSFAPLPMPDVSYLNSQNVSSLNRKMDDSFAPLPMPDVSYLNSQNITSNDYDIYDSSFSRILNTSQYSYIDKDQKSFNSDVMPLVGSHPKKTYDSSSNNYNSQYSKYNKYQ